MTSPVTIGHRLGGFTLIEMLVVIAVLTMLAGGYYGPQLLADTRRIQRTQADIIAQEISMLGAAAQSYALAHAGHWPRQDDDCRQAHLELTHRLPEQAFDRDTVFYAQEEITSPLFAINEKRAYPGRYYFDCNEDASGKRHLFRVGLMLDGYATVWGDYIANQLPNSETIDGPPEGDDIVGLQVSWPEMTVLPALDEFVVKSDPRFEAHLDIDGYSVYDAGEVALRSGQTLASALQYAGIAKPGNYVNKPDCPPSLVPQLVAVPVEMGHEDLQALTYFRTYASDLGDRWRIHSRVYGAESESLDATRIRVSVFTSCS